MFRLLRNGLAAVSTVIALLIGLSSSAQAGLLDTYLVPNEINFFEDNSREAYFDVNNDNTFGAGDVLVGFIRIEQRTAPTEQDVGNTLYAVFTTEVESINAFGVVNFIPTTVSGLQLSDFVAGAETNAMVALYSGDVGTDLTLNSPGDLTGGGVTLLDYITAITAGTLELTAGIAPDSDDQFKAFATIGLPLGTDTIAGLETTDSVAIFEAILSILTNNTSFSFADDVCSGGFVAGIGGIPADTCSQLQIVTGNVLGASNAANAGLFTDGSELGAFQQCNTDPEGQGNNVPCGFIDNADLNVHPIAVPEPASMILFGIGLVALGAYGRRANRRKSA